MSVFEYRVVPAPDASVRLEGVTRTDDPFAKTVEEILNQNAREGWHYVRTDVVTERRGRWPMRKRRVMRELLVFRRDRRALLGTPAPRRMDTLVLSETDRVRARKIKRKEVVEFVRAGGRRIAPTAADAPIVTAAE